MANHRHAQSSLTGQARNVQSSRGSEISSSEVGPRLRSGMHRAQGRRAVRGAVTDDESPTPLSVAR